MASCCWIGRDHHWTGTLDEVGRRDPASCDHQRETLNVVDLRRGQESCVHLLVTLDEVGLRKVQASCVRELEIEAVVEGSQGPLEDYAS